MASGGYDEAGSCLLKTVADCIEYNPCGGWPGTVVNNHQGASGKGEKVVQCTLCGLLDHVDGISSGNPDRFLHLKDCTEVLVGNLNSDSLAVVR